MEDGHITPIPLSGIPLGFYCLTQVRCVHTTAVGHDYRKTAIEKSPGTHELNSLNQKLPKIKKPLYKPKGNSGGEPKKKLKLRDSNKVSQNGASTVEGKNCLKVFFCLK